MASFTHCLCAFTGRAEVFLSPTGSVPRKKWSISSSSHVAYSPVHGIPFASPVNVVKATTCLLPVCAPTGTPVISSICLSVDSAIAMTDFFNVHDKQQLASNVLLTVAYLGLNSILNLMNK